MEFSQLPLGHLRAAVLCHDDHYIDRQVLSLLKGTLDQEIGWTNEQFGWVNASFQLADGLGVLRLVR
jgi:sugar phosphate permease